MQYNSRLVHEYAFAQGIRIISYINIVLALSISANEERAL